MPRRTRRASPGRGRRRTACRGAPSHRTRDRPCARATRSRGGTEPRGVTPRTGAAAVAAGALDQTPDLRLEHRLERVRPLRAERSSASRPAPGRPEVRRMSTRTPSRSGVQSFARNASLHGSEEPVVLHPCREVDQRANGRRDRDRPSKRAIGPVDASAPVDLDQVVPGVARGGTHSSTFRSRRSLDAPQPSAVACETTAPSPAQSAAAIGDCCSAAAATGDPEHAPEEHAARVAGRIRGLIDACGDSRASSAWLARTTPNCGRDRGDVAALGDSLSVRRSLQRLSIRQ